MDTDEHIRSGLRERQPAVDVDRAWSEVRGRAARARRGRLIGLAAASVAVLVGGAAIVGAVTDDDSRVESTDPAVPATVPATPEPGDAATWTTDPSEPPSPKASSIAVLVTRLGCSGGVTGEVLRPGVVFDRSQVVITFTVAALGPGDFTCPGNDAVPFEVDLGEPLGDRTLVDGLCTGSDRPGGTSYCEFGAVRWPLDGADPEARREVSGRLLLVGGPVGTEPSGAPGEIDAITPAGEVVATVATGADGSFTMTLAPGAYRLEGHTSQYQAGEAACTAEIEVGSAILNDLTDVVVACQRR